MCTSASNSTSWDRPKCHSWRVYDRWHDNKGVHWDILQQARPFKGKFKHMCETFMLVDAIYEPYTNT